MPRADDRDHGTPSNGYLHVRTRGRCAPARKRDGADTDDRAVRPIRQTRRVADRNGEQDGADDGILHVARGRLAAAQPDRRPLQDAGLGSRAPSRRAGTHRGQSAERRSRSESDGRKRSRHHVSRSRSDPLVDARGLRRWKITARGFAPSDVALVRTKVESTHWKRHLPTTAMLSSTAINEFYLRPVDF